MNEPERPPRRELRERRLRALGLSEPVVGLATADHSEDMFFFRCQDTPPAEELHFPEGRTGEPLWQCEGWVTAVRERDGRPEFVAFDADDPEVWQVIAYTEQGLLANLLSDLIEDEDWEEETEESLAGLRAAAETVGFHHLDDLLAFAENHADDEDYAETLADWTKTL